MSVKIRLRRMGRTNTPFYRVVATDSRCSNTGRFLESLGWYDPVKSGANFSLQMDRVDYWKSNGAIFSDTVKSLVRKARKGQMAVPPAPAAAVEPAPAEPVVEAVPAAADVPQTATEES
jgi:small subunit ribosomal protein S16